MQNNRSEIIRPVQSPVMGTSENRCRIINDQCRDRQAVYAAQSLDHPCDSNRRANWAQCELFRKGESIIARLHLESLLLRAHSEHLEVERHIAQQHTIQWC